MCRFLSDSWPFSHWSLLLLLLSNTCSAEEIDLTPLQCDPAQVLGADACAKCHENEVKQWKLTPPPLCYV